MSLNLDSQYWSERYRNNALGWDIGYVSTPIKEYIDQLTNKEIQILIPGAGNAYEAEYFHQQGFQNVTVLDISPEPLDNLMTRVPTFNEEFLIEGNFFDHFGQYDLIIEQTFFCALKPSMRESYVEKMSSLLKPGGKLIGLLFNIELFKDRPPFGGKKEDYYQLFDPLFEINAMEQAYNSIPPRKGAELFINLVKRIKS